MKSIYHYTDLNALMGMIGASSKDAEFWLTSINFMNDSAEYSIETARFRSVVEEATKNKFNGALDDLINTAIRDRIFIGSFSKKPDQLSQWRGYCKNGGVCIEFDCKSLAQLIEAQENSDLMLFGPCIYKNHAEYTLENISNIKRIIESGMEELSRFFDSGDREKAGVKLKEMSADLCLEYAEVIPFLKNEKFHEEEEVRVMSISLQKDLIRFRPASGYLTPYVAIKSTDEISVRDCIKKVIIGPGAHQDRCEKSIKILFDVRGIKIKTEKSSIPLVYW